MKLSKSIGEMFERKDETHMTEVSWVPLSEQDQRRVCEESEKCSQGLGWELVANQVLREV